MSEPLLFPVIDTSTWFYKNCRIQRRRGAKICQCCPFREGIEQQERTTRLEALVSHFDHEFSQCEELLTAGIDAHRKVIVTQGMEKIIREREV